MYIKQFVFLVFCIAMAASAGLARPWETTCRPDMVLCKLCTCLMGKRQLSFTDFNFNSIFVTLTDFCTTLTRNTTHCSKNQPNCLKQFPVPESSVCEVCTMLDSRCHPAVLNGFIGAVGENMKPICQRVSDVPY